MKRNISEDKFRSALGRLIQGAPLRVPLGTPLTQGNVAREAGVTPSALRKSRFPRLIDEIQALISDQSLDRKSEQPTLVRDLKSRIVSLKNERDIALSLLVQADAEILRLSAEVKRLGTRIQEASKANLHQAPVPSGGKLRIVEDSN